MTEITMPRRQPMQGSARMLRSPTMPRSPPMPSTANTDRDDGENAAQKNEPPLPQPAVASAAITKKIRPSETVIENLIKYLSEQNIEEFSSEDKVQVSIWDFAGQQLYYASHPVFFSPRAVYILVLNLEKGLNSDVEPCKRQGVSDTNLDTHEKQTNLDSILSWLVSVHSVRPKNNGSKDGEELQYLRPPVIIVGTHADCPFEAPEKMEAEIQKSLSGKSYNHHVVKAFIAVDNKSEDKKGVQEVRNQVLELFGKEPYIGEYVPLRWFMFEKVIKTVVDGEGINHLPLRDLEKVVFEVCHIENPDEIAAMLNFYHDLGIIVKYGNSVVLNAEWLIDLFKRLITINPFNKQIPIHRMYWEKLEDTGILDMELVEAVFDDAIKRKGSEVKQDILAMMESYALIAKFGTADDFQYFVPAQLQSSPGDLDEEPKEFDPCAIYLQFKDGFVPHGLYYSLISKLIAWCSEKQYLIKPKLFKNVSQFAIGCSFEYKLLLICRRSFIKVVLRSNEERSSNFKPAFSVLECLRKCLDTLKNDCFGYHSISYDITVLCPACSKDETKCQKHKLVKCRDDGCHCLLPATNDQDLVCEKAFRKVKVPGLDEWYRDPSMAQRQPEVQEQARPLEANAELQELNTGTFVQESNVIITATSKKLCEVFLACCMLHIRGDENSRCQGLKDMGFSQTLSDGYPTNFCVQYTGIRDLDKSWFTKPKEFIKEKLGLKTDDKIDDFFGRCEKFALDYQHEVFVSDAEETLRLKRSIGAIIAINISDVVKCGATCFRIGTKYVITNKHVVYDIKKLGIQWSRCYVDFNYQEPQQPADNFQFNFAANPELYSSDLLDYAILELNPEGRNPLPPNLVDPDSGFNIAPPGHQLNPEGRNPLPPSLVDPDSGFNIAPPHRQLQDRDWLTFIGHPGGHKKQIDFSCPIKLQQDIQNPLPNHLVCMIQEVYNHPDYAGYNVSTFFEGSSGSPGLLMGEKLLVVLQSKGIPFQGTNKRYALEYGPLMSSVVKDVKEKIENPTFENMTRELDDIFGGLTSSTFIPRSQPMETD